MISAAYRFDEFIAVVRNKSFTEAMRLAEEESETIHRTIIAIQSDTLLESEKSVYYRKLRAFAFFFNHGIKPQGLPEEEFEPLRGLCEKWVALGQLPKRFRAHFESKTATKGSILAHSA